MLTYKTYSVYRNNVCAETFANVSDAFDYLKNRADFEIKNRGRCTLKIRANSDSPYLDVVIFRYDVWKHDSVSDIDGYKTIMNRVYGTC